MWHCISLICILTNGLEIEHPSLPISLNIMTERTLLKYRIYLDLDNAFTTAVKREIVSSDSKTVCCLFSLFLH